MPGPLPKVNSQVHLLNPELLAGRVVGVLGP